MGPLPGDVSAPLEVALLVALLVALGARALGVSRRVSTPSAIGLAAAGAALDQTRLQPWLWLLVVVLALADRATRAPGSGALDGARAAVAGTYLWSGLQKVGVSFVSGVWPRLGAAVIPALAEAPPGVQIATGLGVALLEASFGAGLLVARVRPVALAGVSAMHAFVLAALGPGGLGYNPVVWPWNLGMVALVGTLFARDGGPWPGEPLRGRTTTLAAVVLFLGLPALAVPGLVDDYLSAALYTGASPEAALLVRREALGRIPAGARLAARPAEAGASEVHLTAWSLADLGVPVYPARRVFARVAEDVCRGGLARGDARLVVVGKPWPWSARRSATTTDPCSGRR